MPNLRITRINGKFPNYYAVLEVPQSAPRAVTFSSATGGHAEEFAHIANAREILTDDVKRVQYGAMLAQKQAAAMREEQRRAHEEFARRAEEEAKRAQREAEARAAAAGGGVQLNTLEGSRMSFEASGKSGLFGSAHAPAWGASSGGRPGRFAFNYAQDPNPPPSGVGSSRPGFHGPAYAYHFGGVPRSWTTAPPPYGPSPPTAETSGPSLFGEARNYKPQWRAKAFGPFGRFSGPAIDYSFLGKWTLSSKLEDGVTTIWEKLAELESACVSLCSLMAQVEKLMIEFDAVGGRAYPHPYRPGVVEYDVMEHGEQEPLERWHGAKELLWECLKFLGCGYDAIKMRLETAQWLPVHEASAMMEKYLSSLDRVQVQALHTERSIMKMLVMIKDQGARPEVVTRELEAAIRGWEALVRLPENIVDGINCEFEDRNQGFIYNSDWFRQDGQYSLETWKKAVGMRKQKDESSNGGSGKRRSKKKSSKSSCSDGPDKMDIDGRGEGVPVEEVWDEGDKIT